MISLEFLYPHGSRWSADNVKVWKFPCGEVGVKISDDTLAELREGRANVVVELMFEGSDDLLALGQLVEILRSEFVLHMGLTMKYVPYGRQDRRCFPGEAHALKMFAAYINSLKFDIVVVADPHSYVTEALFDNLRVIPQETCARFLPKFDVLIAPDAGAEKKIFKHSQVAQGTDVVCAQKTRDAQGKIKSVYVPFAQLFDKDVCVVDDLCDGGATFLELGKVIKAREPKSMCLYVTHGMFTNPEKFVELNDMYDRIFVHNLAPQAKAKFGSYVEQL